MHQFRFIRRYMAASLALFLLVNVCVQPVFAHPVVPDVSVTDGVGRVVCNSVSPGRPTIFIFQDIHLHAEAQRNIAEMLHRLARLNGRSPFIVGIEAASIGDVDLDAYRSYTDQRSLGRAARGFLNASLLTGAEHAAIALAPNAILTGLEDSSLYTAHVASLLRSSTSKTQFRTAIAQCDAELQARMKTMLPADERTYIEQWQQAHTAQLNRVEWIHRLIEMGGKPGRLSQHLLRARAMAEALAQRDAAQDVRASATDLARSLESLNSDAINAEINALENSIERRYNLSQEAIASLEVARGVAYLRNVADRALTPAEWASASTLRSLPSLRNQVRRFGGGDAAMFEDFYRLAAQRDGAMGTHFLNRLQQTQMDKNSVAAVVVGGFHAPGLFRQFEQRGYSVVSVVPDISAKTPRSDALRWIATSRTPFESLLAGDRLFLNVVPASAGPYRFALRDALLALASAVKRKGPVRVGQIRVEQANVTDPLSDTISVDGEAGEPASRWRIEREKGTSVQQLNISSEHKRYAGLGRADVVHFQEIYDVINEFRSGDWTWIRSRLNDPSFDRKDLLRVSFFSERQLRSWWAALASIAEVDPILFDFLLSLFPEELPESFVDIARQQRTPEQRQQWYASSVQALREVVSNKTFSPRYTADTTVSLDETTRFGLWVLSHRNDLTLVSGLGGLQPAFMAGWPDKVERYYSTALDRFKISIEPRTWGASSNLPAVVTLRGVLELTQAQRALRHLNGAVDALAKTQQRRLHAVRTGASDESEDALLSESGRQIAGWVGAIAMPVDQGARALVVQQVGNRLLPRFVRGLLEPSRRLELTEEMRRQTADLLHLRADLFGQYRSLSGSGSSERISTAAHDLDLTRYKLEMSGLLSSEDLQDLNEGFLEFVEYHQKALSKLGVLVSAGGESSLAEWASRNAPEPFDQLSGARQIRSAVDALATPSSRSNSTSGSDEVAFGSVLDWVRAVGYHGGEGTVLVARLLNERMPRWCAFVVSKVLSPFIGTPVDVIGLGFRLAGYRPLVNPAENASAAALHHVARMLVLPGNFKLMFEFFEKADSSVASEAHAMATLRRKSSGIMELVLRITDAELRAMALDSRGLTVAAASLIAHEFGEAVYDISHHQLWGAGLASESDLLGNSIPARLSTLDDVAFALTSLTLGRRPVLLDFPDPRRVFPFGPIAKLVRPAEDRPAIPIRRVVWPVVPQRRGLLRVYNPIQDAGLALSSDVRRQA